MIEILTLNDEELKKKLEGYSKIIRGNER